MDRTFLKRALLLVLCMLFVGSLLTLGIAATEQVTEPEVTAQASKNPTNEELGGFFSAQRIEYAITVTLQGMLMIFAVLSILWGVVSLMKGQSLSHVKRDSSLYTREPFFAEWIGNGGWSGVRGIVARFFVASSSE